MDHGVDHRREHQDHGLAAHRFVDRVLNLDRHQDARSEHPGVALHQGRVARIDRGSRMRSDPYDPSDRNVAHHHQVAGHVHRYPGDVAAAAECDFHRVAAEWCDRRPEPRAGRSVVSLAAEPECPEQCRQVVRQEGAK